jgi:CRISPR/Cas system CSM-associated protein Csm3 (group 7 of RAMP superfamily)
MNRHHPLNDAMSPRRLVARWVVCGQLTLETAIHLGGEGDEKVDMPVLREAREGRPLLPGTTFAGALRSALTDRLVGYGEPEPPEIAALFGATRGDDQGSQSPLIVFDALGDLPRDHGVEVRDGVAISPRTGVAEEYKKYDFEVLPAGTTFAVRLDLLLPAPSGHEEADLLQALATALDAFSHGEGAFGAKRSRGLGRVKAVWTAQRFDLSSRKGWLAWILSDHERPLAGIPDRPCIHDVLKAAAPEALRPFKLLDDRRRRAVIHLDLELVHDVLVCSPGSEPDAPDAVHLKSGGKAILPGTSLAGIMRAQALRIARLIRSGQGDAEQWIDRLFGPRFKGQRPSRGVTAQASRLRVAEVPLTGSRAQRQTRVAIDRFTGGVVDTALFDEETAVEGKAKLRLELRNPDMAELGLVLLVLKDLLDGSLPVGGTSNVGRGVFRGRAEVAWHEGNSVLWSAVAEPGKPPSGAQPGKIDEAIQAFHRAQLPAAPSDSGGRSREGVQ